MIFKFATVREIVDEVFDIVVWKLAERYPLLSTLLTSSDKIRFEESVDEFGRVAAQSAKQTIMERVKQMRETTYNDYKQHER